MIIQKKLNFVALSIVVATAALMAQPQTEWCHTDKYEALYAEQISNYAEEKAYADSISQLPLPANVKSKNNGAVKYTIPVVVHVIYASDRDNVTKAQILDGLKVLNDDFQKLNSDTSNVRNIFKNDIADIEVEFKLATKDPNGNCTDGITRTRSALSINAGGNVKNLIGWDNKSYMNIWLVNSINSNSSQGTILGFSSFPRRNQTIAQDGTVMRHDQFGTIGTSASDGRTLTHETGHFLNLYHPFQGGCFGGDQVGDTPPTANANYGCPLGQNTCSNDNPNQVDQLENYMDYTNCVYMFTNGQKSRMHNVLNNSNLRGSLTSATNLSATGVTSPITCAPKPAQVIPNQQVACAGDSIEFTSKETDATATSWSWSFPGGSPSSSTLQNPKVTYSQSGTYDVTLTVGNAQGNNSQTFQEVVSVKRQNPVFAPTYVEDLEATAIPQNLTLSSSFDQNTFRLTTNASSEGNRSLWLNNRTAGIPGDKDAIILPALSATSGSDYNFMFDYAFAARNQSNTDELTVFASSNCGKTWRRKKIIRLGELRTAGFDNSSFVPNASQWATAKVNLDDFVQADPILIKFEFENGGGNNLYIDLIRFGQGNDINVAEQALQLTTLEVFPNPVTANEINLTGRLLSQADLELRIVNLQGQVVFTESVTKPAGKWQHRLNPNKLSTGAYLLEIKAKGTVTRKKLIVQ